MVIRRGKGEFRTLKDKPIIQRKGRRDWRVVGSAPLLPGAKGGERSMVPGWGACL